jgi:hypothetical protein
MSPYDEDYEDCHSVAIINDCLQLDNKL